MHPAGRRTLIVAGAFALLNSAAAGAETVTRVSNETAVDVTADGREILFADGTVLVRRTGMLLDAPAGPVNDLASASPTVLYASGSDWFVRDLSKASNAPVAVNRTPGGARVGIASATLIRDGRAVTFSTTESPSRILTIAVGAARSTELLRNAALLRASDDGRVVTFTRALPDERRPVGKAGQGARASLPGDLVGYLVRDSAPRVVGVTSWLEHLGAPNGAVPCAENPAEYDRTTTTLGLAQDGLAGGRYLLPATTAIDYTWWTGGSTEVSHAWQDPYSAASTSIVDSHYSYPLWNRWSLSTGQAAAGADPQLLPPAGSTDPAGLATALLAYDGGGGAVLSARPRAGGEPGTFVTGGEALPSSDTSGWSSLPRTSDPVLTGRERVRVTWAACQEPPRATPKPTPTPGRRADRRRGIHVEVGDTGRAHRR